MVARLLWAVREIKMSFLKIISAILPTYVLLFFGTFANQSVQNGQGCRYYIYDEFVENSEYLYTVESKEILYDDSKSNCELSTLKGGELQCLPAEILEYDDFFAMITEKLSEIISEDLRNSQLMPLLYTHEAGEKCSIYSQRHNQYAVFKVDGGENILLPITEEAANTLNLPSETYNE